MFISLPEEKDRTANAKINVMLLEIILVGLQ